MLHQNSSSFTVTFGEKVLTKKESNVPNLKNGQGLIVLIYILCLEHIAWGMISPKTTIPMVAPIIPI